MTVRLLGIEHLPSGIGVGTFNTCYGLSQADLGAGAFWNADTATYSNVGHLRIEGGVMTFGARKETTSGQCAGSASLSMNKLMGGVDPNKLIIGFRCTRVGSPLATIPIVALDTVQFGSSGVFANQLLTHAPADALTSNYYEFVFDFTTGKYDIYRDNVILTSQATIPAAITKTTVKNYYWGIGRWDAYIAPAGTDVRLLQFSDMYVINDSGIAGDPDVTRLGPIILKKVNVVSTTGNGWNGSLGSTIPDALNTRRDAGKLVTPYASAPADRTPLRVKVKTDDIAAAGVAVKAFYVGTTAFRDSGVTDNMTAKVSLNSSDSAAVTLTNLSTTTPLDQKVFGGSKGPDGSTLNGTNLGNLEIVFTPTA